MSTLVNFRLYPSGKLSQKLIRQGITDFHMAIAFVRSIPYGKVSDSRSLELLIEEQRGSHSLKHAFLAELARENQINNIKLVLCSFNMNYENTEAAGSVLHQHGIHAIPEITCLLKYQDVLYDISSPDWFPRAEIVSEIEITSQQIGSFKRRYHLNYIENWLQIEKIRGFDVNEIWQIREACIQALTENSKQQAQLCCA